MVFRDIKGYGSRYEISDEHQVWRKAKVTASGDSMRLVKLEPKRIIPDKHDRVSLNDGYTKTKVSLQTLMDEAFPEGHSYMAPAKKPMGRKSKPVYAYNEIDEVKFKSIEELAKYLEVSNQTLRNAMSNSTTVKGYIISRVPKPKPAGTPMAHVEDGLITFTWR